MPRLAASVLALVVLTTSGMIGDVTHVCRMNGMAMSMSMSMSMKSAHARSRCCCKKARAEASHCARIERSNQCCEDRITRARQAPARIEPPHSPVPPVLPLATLPRVVQIATPAGHDVSYIAVARGPPEGKRPALFIEHCRYLV